MNFPFLRAKERLIRIMGTFDLATGHADTWDELLDSLESELRDVLGHYREALAQQADHSEQHLDMVKAQPAQEPKFWYDEEEGLLHEHCGDKPYGCIPLYTTPPQRTEERNFCSRCGKRTADLTVIHTCTPPQRKPLTDDEIWEFWCSRPKVLEGEDDSMEAEFVTAVRAVLAAHNIKENT